MRLNTSRLLLRDFVPEDWEAVQGYAADPEAVRYRPFGPCTDEETKAVIQEASRQIHQSPRRIYDLAIVLADSNELIGGCDIGLLADHSREASIGYGLNRAYWRKSYMSEAASALVAFGFRELNAEAISADVEPANSASIRVLEKIGMKTQGLRKQWIKDESRTVIHYVITLREFSESATAASSTFYSS